MSMKKLALFLVSVLAALSLAKHQTNAQETQEKTIYYFYGQGCGHCAEVNRYFEENGLYEKYPIKKLEIYGNRDNAVLFNITLNKLDYPTDRRGVPTMIIGSKVLVGSDFIIDNFEGEVQAFLESDEPSIVDDPTPEPEPKPNDNDGFQGTENLTIAAVIGASLVDAINPCAFAVLILLMTTILATSVGNAKKALKAGLAFASSIFISYFLMGLGLYKAIGHAGQADKIFIFISGLAILMGLLNLKDAIWYGKVFLVEVPMSWRPKLKSIISSVTTPAGAFLVGFSVSLFLLPCTSGPYIVILGLLANTATQTKAVLYLLLYNLVFVSPMIAITFLVYKGLKPEKLERIRQKHLRTLHLIAGIILLGIGGLLLANTL